MSAAATTTPTPRRLEARNVFITGASRGIGRAIALQCAREGAFVAVGYHQSQEGAQTTARDILDMGGRAAVVAIDVCDPDSIERGIGAFVDQAGGQLDALVANGAVASTGLLATADYDVIKRMIDTNVFGPIACARAAIPFMLPKKAGVLLFVGSIAATRPAQGQAAYATSKAGVESLTRAIAVEYGRKGIRSICIRPGAVNTDMLASIRAMAEEELVSRIPMKRVASPEEIARMATMLLSDDASYVSGSVIDIDGGYSAG